MRVKKLNICSAMSTEYRRVTDRPTDKHLATALSALCIRVARQKLMVSAVSLIHSFNFSIIFLSRLGDVPLQYNSH